MNVRMNYTRREQAGIIGALAMTTIALVGVIVALNWGPGLGNDFYSPGSAVVSEIDGILPSGLASDLVGNTFISTETHARVTLNTVCGWSPVPPAIETLGAGRVISATPTPVGSRFPFGPDASSSLGWLGIRFD